MTARIFPFVFLALFTIAPPPSHAQAERTSPNDIRTLQLVDSLKDVIRRWENNRTVNAQLLNQLRDLVRLYDWPWRVRLLFDDFRDGDYTRNPTWVVRGGEYSAGRGFGLRTVMSSNSVAQPPADRRRELTPVDIIGGILKGIAEPGGATTPLKDAPSTAEISTAVAIGNAFAIRVRMLSQEKPVTGARLEFGPYRGNGREWGYRLAYNPGQRPSFEILRLSPGRSSVVETYDVFAELEDSRVHEVEWRRDREGSMSVFLDGREIIRTVDRGITEFFDGFAIVNLGGDYTFEQIEIFGAER